jgi:hypothetical protein
MNDLGAQDFDIRIEFERGVGDPTRVFRAMAGLIESAQTMDTHLAAMLGATVRTSLVLQDVEATSLKSRLRSIVEGIPDEPLKQGEVKKLIGHFLLKGKHKILDWCGSRKEISDRGEVKQLEAELESLAQETDIKQLPAYAPIGTPALLSDLAAVNDALAPLEQHDSATLSSSTGHSQYNPHLVVSEAVIREIVTSERISSTGERILKVKKPDYLGTSKWGFRYGNHMIEARIADLDWLGRFQSNLENVNPGDSLRVMLFEEVSYGYDKEVVHTEYEVRKVLGVIRGSHGQQSGLIEPQ